MCIRDRARPVSPTKATPAVTCPAEAEISVLILSLIHISEPTRLLSISYAVFCFKRTRRPPRSTRVRSSAASDVYKRQGAAGFADQGHACRDLSGRGGDQRLDSVSYTHLRAHETPEHLVCRLLL